MKYDQYTVLSHGMGTDSCTIMELFLRDKKLRDKYVKGECIVIFSDLGLEYPETYKQIPRQRKICKELGWTFVHLTPDMGFHPNLVKKSKKATDIFDWWWDARAIAMTAGAKKCTDRWKIQPIWDFISYALEDRYDYGEVNTPNDRKIALKKYGMESGKKIRLILGFTYEEEERVQRSYELEDADSDFPGRWGHYVQRHFPLYDLGWTRRDCIGYFRDVLKKKPPRPSNCMMCMYQSPAEILYLYKKYPEVYKRWVQLEKRKIAADRKKGVEKNLGVKGAKLLPEQLKAAQEQFGDISMKELYELIMVHGCQIKSNY